MPLDTSIPLQAVAPDPLQKISGLLAIAQNALAYKKAQATFDPSVQTAQGQAASAVAKGQVDQANVQPLIQQQGAQTSTAQTGAQSAKFRLQNDYMGTALQTASGLMNDPRIAADPQHYDPEAATNAILEAKNQMIAKGVPASQAELATAPLIMQIHTPGAVQQMLKNSLTGQLTPQGQAGAISPTVLQTTSGQKTYTNNTNALGPGGVGAPVINPIQQLPGPSTQVVNPETGAPAVLGVMGGGNTGGMTGYSGGSPQAAAVDQRAIMLHEMNQPGISADDKAAIQREMDRLPATAESGASMIPAGLPPGQVANLQNNFAQMNTHYEGLQGAATNSQLATSLVGNIKSLSQSALTGTESGREAYVTGLLNTLGIGGKSTGDWQKDTDLLQKNLAQLNLSTPASTDAARVLVNAARPHSTMSAAAIQEAADQVSSQIQANVAERNYLTPFKYANGGKGDPQAYQAARQQIENAADPRIWQLKDMNPQEQTTFMKKLTPEDRATLVQKSRALHNMGMLQ